MQHVIRLADDSLRQQKRPNARVLESYERTSAEFLSFIDNMTGGGGGGGGDYVNRIHRMVDKLNELTGINTAPVLTLPSKYYTETWGSLYWTFLHATSILVAYFIEIGKLHDTLDFPLIVYNIDRILPCSMCKTHYEQIKHTEAIKSCVKRMAFGFTISALLEFHNIITHDIYKHEYKYKKEPRPFSIIDMSMKWNAIENDSNITTHATVDEYLKPHVDWQTEIHTALSILCAIERGTNYIEASNYMKTVVYKNLDDPKNRDLFFDLVSMKQSAVEKIHSPDREFYLQAVQFLFVNWYEKFFKVEFESRITDSEELARVKSYATGIEKSFRLAVKDTNNNANGSNDH